MRRVVFIGAEELGWRALRELMALGCRPVAVFTLDERAAANVVGFRSFRDLERAGVPIHYVTDINDPEVVRTVRAAEPDIIYQVGWSQLLKPEILGLARGGCIGMHGTLLPKHRGRAPVPWSIIFGLRRSGMTLFYLTEEADKGDLIGQVEFSIRPEDSATEVYQKSVEAAAQLIRHFHPLIECGRAPRISQDLKRSDYWPRRTPQDGLIDWNRAARYLDDWVRALTHPFPGAFTYRGDHRVTIWRARPEPAVQDGQPGEVLRADPGGVLVAAGEGVLAVLRVQPEGGPEQDAGAWADTVGLRPGDRLG